MTTSRAKYICIEGTEGCYKTTNTRALANSLELMGKKVLQTKEPGTPALPLTNILRGVMLDKQYDSQLTRPARELISQAIRSIHLERLVGPALATHDYIIQDRGLMSGFAYGIACGNDFMDISDMVDYIVEDTPFDPMVSYSDEAPNPAVQAVVLPWMIYDHVIFLKGDTEKGLQIAAAAKQEFAAGDNIEARGLDFMKAVEENFMEMIENTPNVTIIDVTGKTPQVILTEILTAIGEA